MKFAVLPVTAFEQNCTLFWCEETMKGAIIDPGGDPDRVLQMVEQFGVTLEKVLVTHGHMDHAGSVASIAKKLSIPIEGPHKNEEELIAQIPQQSKMFGIDGDSFAPTRWLNDGDKVTFGNITLEVYHCPGHTPGHVVFFNREAKLAQVGDVLFAGSVGRSDFPGGDHDQLMNSIVDKLWPLGDDVTFIPGHGPESTFGHERRTNPYTPR